MGRSGGVRGKRRSQYRGTPAGTRTLRVTHGGRRAAARTAARSDSRGLKGRDVGLRSRRLQARCVDLLLDPPVGGGDAIGEANPRGPPEALDPSMAEVARLHADGTLDVL